MAAAAGMPTASLNIRILYAEHALLVSRPDDVLRAMTGATTVEAIRLRALAHALRADGDSLVAEVSSLDGDAANRLMLEAMARFPTGAIEALRKAASWLLTRDSLDADVNVTQAMLQAAKACERSDASVIEGARACIERAAAVGHESGRMRVARFLLATAIHDEIMMNCIWDQFCPETDADRLLGLCCHLSFARFRGDRRSTSRPVLEGKKWADCRSRAHGRHPRSLRLCKWGVG